MWKPSCVTSCTTWVVRRGLCIGKRLECRMQSETIEFPGVAAVECGITTDGQQMLVQLATVDRGPIHFRLRLSDMESFVTFLLCTAAEARATGTAEDRARYQPIPVSGVSAGELAD